MYTGVAGIELARVGMVVVNNVQGRSSSSSFVAMRDWPQCCHHLWLWEIGLSVLNTSLVLASVTNTPPKWSSPDGDWLWWGIVACGTWPWEPWTVVTWPSHGGCWSRGQDGTEVALYSRAAFLARQRRAFSRPQRAASARHRATRLASLVCSGLL